MSEERETKKTPAEVLAAIEKMDDDDEMDRILALSDEELDGELASEGFDPAEIRQQGRDIGRDIGRKIGERARQPYGGATSGPKDGSASAESAPPAEPTKAPRSRGLPRWTFLLAAALGALAIAGALLLPRSSEPEKFPRSPESDGYRAAHPAPGVDSGTRDRMDAGEGGARSDTP